MEVQAVMEPFEHEDELVSQGGGPFVKQLQAGIRAFWEARGASDSTSYLSHRSAEDVRRRVCAAVFNEMRNAELCARWVRDVPDTNLRMSLAKQSWQEFRHYKLVCDRVRRFGVDPADCPPTAQQREMFDMADGFFDWLQRITFMQFAGEGCSVYYQNEQLIELATELGDAETAALYRDHIQPDERFHGQIGFVAIRDHAATPERRRAVLQAVREFLAVRQRQLHAHHQAMAVRSDR